MMPDLDLWPDDIRVDVLTPLQILRAQVPALRNKTQGILVAQVESREAEGEKIHELHLVAPGVNYKVLIFSVRHRGNMDYPCVIDFMADADGSCRAVSQADFIQYLKAALKSSPIRSVIDSLLALASSKDYLREYRDGACYDQPESLKSPEPFARSFGTLANLQQPEKSDSAIGYTHLPQPCKSR